MMHLQFAVTLKTHTGSTTSMLNWFKIPCEVIVDPCAVKFDLALYHVIFLHLFTIMWILESRKVLHAQTVCVVVISWNQIFSPTNHKMLKTWDTDDYDEHCDPGGMTTMIKRHSLLSWNGVVSLWQLDVQHDAEEPHKIDLCQQIVEKNRQICNLYVAISLVTVLSSVIAAINFNEIYQLVILGAGYQILGKCLAHHARTEVIITQPRPNQT